MNLLIKLSRSILVILCTLALFTSCDKDTDPFYWLLGRKIPSKWVIRLQFLLVFVPNRQELKRNYDMLIMTD